MNNTIKNLPATFQKSYYGKAKTYTENGKTILISYNTEVCYIDKATNKFVRLWSGYSVTTQNHINDFRTQNGLPKLSKKEWLSIPCENKENTYNIYYSNGFYAHKSSAVLTETEAEKECKRVKNIMPNISVWYE